MLEITIQCISRPHEKICYIPLEVKAILATYDLNTLEHDLKKLQDIFCELSSGSKQCPECAEEREDECDKREEYETKVIKKIKICHD